MSVRAALGQPEHFFDSAIFQNLETEAARGVWTF